MSNKSTYIRNLIVVRMIKSGAFKSQIVSNKKKELSRRACR